MPTGIDGVGVNESGCLAGFCGPNSGGNNFTEGVEPGIGAGVRIVGLGVGAGAAGVG